MGFEGTFASDFSLGSVLGTGAYSTVREGKEKSTGRVYAVKCVDKRKLSEEDGKALIDEIGILKGMSHRGIIKLHSDYDEKVYHYIVLENMDGGELFDRIVAKQYYNELDARACVRSILEALNYIHNGKVAHRDLKPENLLLRSKADDSDVKIADFGFAKKCPSPMCLATQCGTPGYVAPEILRGEKYDYSADMWSLGVIMYIILGGYPPFYEDNQALLFKKIKSGSYEFHPDFWGAISSDAKDLISRCLTVPVADRITCEEACRHPWMAKADRSLSKTDLGRNLEELKKYNAKRKFRAAVKAVVAANKLKSLIQAADKEGPPPPPIEIVFNSCCAFLYVFCCFVIVRFFF